MISKIYQNISFEELGRFLEIPAAQAELIIASMVSENRIKAILDQKARIVEFLSSTGNDSKSLNMHTYNSQIHNVCTNLNQLLQEVLKKYPELQKYDTHLF